MGHILQILNTAKQQIATQLINYIPMYRAKSNEELRKQKSDQKYFSQKRKKKDTLYVLIEDQLN